MNATRSKGYIKWQNPTRKFGFLISSDENREIFFHFSDCNFEPEINAEVEFSIGVDTAGRAKAMKIIKTGSETNGNDDK